MGHGYSTDFSKPSTRAIAATLVVARLPVKHSGARLGCPSRAIFGVGPVISFATAKSCRRYALPSRCRAGRIDREVEWTPKVGHSNLGILLHCVVGCTRKAR